MALEFAGRHSGTGCSGLNILHRNGSGAQSRPRADGQPRYYGTANADQRAPSPTFTETAEVRPRRDVGKIVYLIVVIDRWRRCLRSRGDRYVRTVE